MATSLDRVLLAEDDEGVREGMADILADRAQVVAVDTVEAALGALEREQFRVVFADMKLGGEQDGGRRIAEKAHARGTKVVVMTGMAVGDVDRMLGGLAAEAVLTKPFAVDEAVAVLDRLLQG